jgi:hypothetical protein
VRKTLPAGFACTEPFRQGFPATIPGAWNAPRGGSEDCRKTYVFQLLPRPSGLNRILCSLATRTPDPPGAVDGWLSAEAAVGRIMVEVGISVHRVRAEVEMFLWD